MYNLGKTRQSNSGSVSLSEKVWHIPTCGQLTERKMQELRSKVPLYPQNLIKARSKSVNHRTGIAHDHGFGECPPDSKMTTKKVHSTLPGKGSVPAFGLFFPDRVNGFTGLSCPTLPAVDGVIGTMENTHNLGNCGVV